MNVLFCSALVLICTWSCTESLPSVFKFEQGRRAQDAEASCGYETCELGEGGDMLNVHLVPHTHDDVGWLKTVDQYYYGARGDIRKAGVQYIIDSVISELRDDPKKRFIYVEIAFFYRWWNEQHDSLRHVVKGLVNEGRLEFILGGWCMNDEASTHYSAIIDQHSAGFYFLERNFGDCARPKIGWQIDPFGHSREQASLFAQFGFDGLFFGRLDYQDKEKRLKDKHMELVWMGSDNLGDQGALFTGVNYNGYNPPAGFCFDQGCSDPPVMDDDRLEDYNVDDIVKSFIKAANDQAGNFTTKHIMMTMGSDFQYQNAHQNFKNLDKLIKYVNEKSSVSKVNAFYSTPSCYLYALNRANQTYTAKHDDFFPYASDAHQFWTGYFTSRPSFKGYVRETNNFFQNVKQLDTLAQLEAEFSSNYKIDILRRALGVAQHHDAVSGTEKQAVTYDYSKRLAIGVAACQEVLNSAYSKLIPLNKTHTPPVQMFCDLLNVSYCSTTEDKDKFTVTLYNPIGRPVNSWVRVPVTKSQYSVLDPKGDKVTSQVVPISAETKNIPAHNVSKATGELLFMAELPPLGFKTFFVDATPGVKGYMAADIPVAASDTVIKNEHLQLTFDADTGLLKEIVNLDKKITQKVSQKLMYYNSAAGNNSKPEFQASGAYIFRPEDGTTDATEIAPKVKITVVGKAGDLVQEVHQVFDTWASQVIRLYAGEKYAEFEWTVGPIPFKLDDNVGKEIISRFHTDLVTQKTFYTDANGREILKRVVDYRETWTLNQTEPIAGNYYPVNSRIYIQGSGKTPTQLTVLTDRSQGGASLKDGDLELMVHRRMFMDDKFGVGEALNETGISGKGLVVRGKHYVFLETVQDSGRLHRDMAQRVFMAPTVSFSDFSDGPKKYTASFKGMWTGLKTVLPANVHLLTLEQWKAATFLLRLEHFYEKNEDPALSKPATVDLKALFVPFEIDKVVELTLGANEPLEEATRLRWNVKDFGRTRGGMSDFVTPVTGDAIAVTLKPMQIRTFQVHIVE